MLILSVSDQKSGLAALQPGQLPAGIKAEHGLAVLEVPHPHPDEKPRDAAQRVPSSGCTRTFKPYLLSAILTESLQL